MKKNTKKKVFTLMLVIMLLSIAIVGGSLAWFTAESEVAKNTFTVGSIKIQQNEKDESGNNFEQNQAMMPVVNKDNPSADKNYIHKVVTVTNTGDNPAYVRTHIAVPTQLLGYLHLTVDLNNPWHAEGEYITEVDGVEYTVFYYRYDTQLEADKQPTPALLKGVYMDAAVDVRDGKFCMPSENRFSDFSVEDKIQVLVVTQAVQADGFENCEDALTKAFNIPDSSSNPFVAG